MAINCFSSKGEALKLPLLLSKGTSSAKPNDWTLSGGPEGAQREREREIYRASKFSIHAVTVISKPNFFHLTNNTNRQNLHSTIYIIANDMSPSVSDMSKSSDMSKTSCPRIAVLSKVQFQL